MRSQDESLEFPAEIWWNYLDSESTKHLTVCAHHSGDWTLHESQYILQFCWNSTRGAWCMICSPIVAAQWASYLSISPITTRLSRTQKLKILCQKSLSLPELLAKTSVKLTTTLDFLCKSIKRLSTSPSCSIFCNKGKPHLRTWTLLFVLEHRFAKEMYSVRWSSRGFCPRPVWHPSYLLSNVRKLVVLVGTELKMWWSQWWLTFETCGDVNNNMHYDILSVENSATLE